MWASVLSHWEQLTPELPLCAGDMFFYSACCRVTWQSKLPPGFMPRCPAMLTGRPPATLHQALGEGVNTAEVAGGAVWLVRGRLWVDVGGLRGSGIYEKCWPRCSTAGTLLHSWCVILHSLRLLEPRAAIPALALHVPAGAFLWMEKQCSAPAQGSVQT